MGQSELADRKSEMIDFLEGNIIAKRIECEDNTLHLLDNKDRPFIIETISGNKEFKELIDFTYEQDNQRIDNDRYELLGMLERLIDHIIDINESGEGTPGTILLQSKTDFRQAKRENRKDRIVNRQGFNKQYLETNLLIEPNYNIRKLSQSEIVIWTLNQHTIGKEQAKKIYVPKRGFYLPELTMYNPNKHFVEVCQYQHLFSPSEYEETKNFILGW